VAGTTPAERGVARPPDVRGPSAPFPRAVFAIGAAALLLVVVGTVVIQVDYAVVAPPLSPDCLSVGIDRDFVGAAGVCHIIEGLRSAEQRAVLLLAIVMGIVAMVGGFSRYRRMDTLRKRDHAFDGAILGVHAVTASLFLLWFTSTHAFLTFAKLTLNFKILEGHIDDFVRAAKNTLIMAFGGEAGGITLGLVLSLLAMSSRRVVRAPARAYINFFRGTPLIWQLSFFYYGLFLGFGWNPDPFVAAIIVFALNMGGYSAEVFRAGIQSIERGQLEAARGLGMSHLQSMRYVIVPQAIRRVIPPLMNEFVILIKDTALVLALGLGLNQLEIYNTSQTIYSDTFSATAFVAAAIGYLAITLPLIGIVNYAERRLRSGLVGVAGGGV
jgi:His/Glu/Gln/Arg/opine family amino acid ABC transporter permease subunit